MIVALRSIGSIAAPGTIRIILSPFTKGCRVRGALMRVMKFFAGVFHAYPLWVSADTSVKLPRWRHGGEWGLDSRSTGILAGGAIALSMTPSGDVLIAS